jgi:hypothetical protein
VSHAEFGTPGVALRLCVWAQSEACQ